MIDKWDKTQFSTTVHDQSVLKQTKYKPPASIWPSTMPRSSEIFLGQTGMIKGKQVQTINNDPSDWNGYNFLVKSDNRLKRPILPKNERSSLNV